MYLDDMMVIVDGFDAALFYHRRDASIDVDTSLCAKCARTYVVRYMYECAADLVGEHYGSMESSRCQATVFERAAVY